MMLNASVTAAYAVVRTFKAKAPISGHERQFKKDETITYEAGQTAATVTFGFEGAFYLIDRSTFKSCCVFKDESIPFF
jgi:hypothetical protein